MANNTSEFMRRAIQTFGEELIDIEGSKQYGLSERGLCSLIIANPRESGVYKNKSNTTKTLQTHIKQFINHWCEFYDFHRKIEQVEVWYKYECGALV